MNILISNKAYNNIRHIINSYLFFEVHKKELLDFLNLFLNSNNIT